MLKIGFIGFGKMGLIRAEAVENSGLAEICSIFELKKIPLKYEKFRVNSKESIFKSNQIDAIFICVPNKFNEEYTLEALKNSKHVFCEKPPAFSSIGVERIINAENSSKKKVMYGFNHRHHESIIKINQLVKSKQYGNLLWMRGRYGKSVDVKFFDTWRAKKEIAGGGILLDQGIHMLDLFLMLGGDFDHVLADVSNLYWKLDIEDNVFAIYKNTNSGVVASLHSTMTQWRHLFSLEVFLEKGYLVLNGLKTSSGTYGEETLSIAKNRTTAPEATWEDEERLIFHNNTSWDREVKSFLKSIITDSKIEIGTTKQAYNVMRLVDLTYKKGAINE